ncbi:MAG: hypothetical protein RDV41_07895, partial [Planctomycetota bacterium]|nr:hypothetical protein [Planctomycetota bacterium]
TYLNIRLGAGGQNFFFSYCNFDGVTNSSVTTDPSFANGIIEMSYSNTTPLTENDKENGTVEGTSSTIEWIRNLVWDGSENSLFTNANNWTPVFAPDFTSDLTIPGGGGIPNNPILNLDASCRSLNITTGLLTINTNLTLNVYGDFNIAPGGLSMTNGKIAFRGGNPNQAINPGGCAIYDMEVNKPGNISAISAPITVTNNLIVAAGELKLLTYAVTVGGQTTVSDKLSITTGSLTANGPFTASGGTLDLGGGTLTLGHGTVSSLGTFTGGTSTVRYTATANQTILASGISYHNLVVNKPAGSTAFTSAIASLSVGNSFTVAGGNLTCQNSMDINGAFVFDAAWTGAFSAGTFGHTVAGNFSFGGSGTFGAGTGTFTLDGTAQSIGGANANPLAFNILTIAGTAVASVSRPFTSGSTLTVNGELSIGSGQTVTANALARFAGTLRFQSDPANGSLFDANSELNATGGSVIFTSGGRLFLGGAVTSLGAFTPATGIVRYDGATDQTVRTVGLDYYDLEIAKAAGTTASPEAAEFLGVQHDLTLTSGILAASNAAEVGRNFRINGGTFTAGAFTHKVGGAFDVDTNTFTPDTSTILMNGLASSIEGDVSPVGFYGLSVQTAKACTANVNVSVTNPAGSITLNGALTVADNRTVSCSGLLRVAGTLEFAGANSYVDANATFNGNGGTITFSGPGTLELSSQVDALASTFTAGAGTVLYNSATASQTIQPASYFNLTINKAGQIGAVGGVTTIGGNLVVQAGTFAVDTASVTVNGTTTSTGIVRISTGTLDADGPFNSAGGAVTFTASGTLRLDAAPQSLGTFTPSTGTVVYGDTVAPGDWTILNVSYYNLTIACAGFTASLGANQTVSNNLTVSSGTLAMSGFNLSVAGDLAATGTINVGAGTLEVTGTTNAAGGTLNGNTGTIRLLGPVSSLGTFNAGTGTVRYASSTVGQTLQPVTYSTLQVATSGGQYVTVTDTANVDAALTVTAGAELRIATPGDLRVNGATATVNGRLRMDGLTYLRLGNATLLNISGASAEFASSASGAGDKPLVSSTYSPPTPAQRYAFLCQSSAKLSVSGLEMQYADTNGLDIYGDASTALNINDILFNNGIDPGGTYLTTRFTGAGGPTLQFLSCVFNSPSEFNVSRDAGFTGSIDMVDSAGDKNGSAYERDPVTESNPGLITWSYLKQWIGTTNEAWNTTTNWSGSSVPTSATSVRVPNPANNRNCKLCTVGSATPITANAKTLLITTGTLRYRRDNAVGAAGTALNSTLNVYGNFTRETAGTFDMPDTGTLAFRGNAPSQTLNTNNANIWNLQIKNAGETGTVYLDSDQTVRGSLNLAAGTFDIGSYNLTIGYSGGGAGNVTGPGTLRIGGGTVTVYGTFNPDGPVEFYGPGTLILRGAVTDLGTAFTAGTGTVVYKNTAADVTIVTAGITYYNLTVDNTPRVATAGGPLAVTSNLTVTSGTCSASATGGQNVTVGGTVTITSGTLDINNRDISVSGNFTNNGGTLSYGAPGNGLVTFAATGDQTLGGTTATTFRNATVAASSTTKVQTNNTTFSAGYALALNGIMEIASGVTVVAGSSVTMAVGTGKLKFLDGTNHQFQADGTTTLNGAVEFVSGGLLELGEMLPGTWTLSAGTGTVKFDYTIAGTTVPALTYYNLEIATGAQVAAAAGSFSVQNNVTVTSGVFDVGATTVTVGGITSFGGAGTRELRIGTGTYDANGTFTGTGGTVNLAGNGLLELSGAVSTAPGSFNTSGAAASTVRFNSTSSDVTVWPAVAPNPYRILRIACTGRMAALAGATTVSADLVVASGTLAVGGFSIGVGGSTTVPGGNLSVGAGSFDASGTFDAVGGTVSLTAGATLNLGGAVNSLGTFNAAATSTTRYYGSSAQNVPGVTFGNLNIDKSGSSTATAAGNISVGGSLTTAADAVFAVATRTVTVTGAVTSNGGTTISTGKLDCNSSFTAGGTSFISFTGAGRLELGGAVTSLGTLTTATGCTVRYDDTAADQTINVYAFENLEVAKGTLARTATLAGSLTGANTVNGSLSVLSGTLSLGTVTSYDLDANGATSVSGNQSRVTIGDGTMTANSSFSATDSTLNFAGATGGLLVFRGSVASTNVTLNPGAAGTVRYAAGAAQTVQPWTYRNLAVAKDAGTVATLAGTATAQGTFNLSGGTFAVSTLGLLYVDGAATLSAAMTMTGGAELQLKASIALNNGGSFTTTESGGVKPRVTWKDSTRYSFDVNSGATIFVQGLRFSGANANGLCVNSGATITDIDTVEFTNGAGDTNSDGPVTGSNTFLNVRLGAGG